MLLLHNRVTTGQTKAYINRSLVTVLTKLLFFHIFVNLATITAVRMA